MTNSIANNVSTIFSENLSDLLNREHSWVCSAFISYCEVNNIESQIHRKDVGGSVAFNIPLNISNDITQSVLDGSFKIG